MRRASAYSVIYGSLVMLALSGVEAAPLWQNAHTGMTMAQVRAAFPSAVTPTKKNKIAGGATCELEIPRYEVASDNYRVCFFFKSNSLIQVMLSAENPNQSQFE